MFKRLYIRMMHFIADRSFRYISTHEAVGMAMVRLVDELQLRPEDTFQGAVFSASAEGRQVPPFHFAVQLCHTPDTCFPEEFGGLRGASYGKRILH